MSTTTYTATVPVGIAPSGVTLTVPLRRNSVVLIEGFAGTGKSVLLSRMRNSLELQRVAVFHAERIRANADDVILAARAELEARKLARDEPTTAAVLLVDDLGVLLAERDLGHEVVRAIREIAIKGRAAGVHLVLAAQSSAGIPGALLMQASARIDLAADHGGVLTDSVDESTPFTALPL